MNQVEELLRRPIARQEIVMFVGLPGAGKSTLYRRIFADSHVHVSLDVLRKRSRERQTLEEHLAAGRSVVVDNTNVKRTERAIYLEIARRSGVPVRCIHLLIDLRDALRRNAGRQGKARIPDVGVIAKHKAFDYPLIEEGFARLQRIRVLDDGTIEMVRDIRSAPARRRKGAAGAN